MANLKIPNKTLADNFNLQDFKDDFTALNAETTDWTNFKANGGTINGNIETKDIGLNGSLYIKNGIPVNQVNPLQYSRFVRPENDTTPGNMKLQLGANGSFEVIDSSWSKSLLKVDWNGIHIGSSFTELTGYTRLPNGFILQWGSGTVLNTGATEYAVIPIALPIAFPNRPVIGSACTTSYNDNTTWGAYINTSAYCDSNKITINTIRTNGSYFSNGDRLTYNWFAIGY